MDNIGCLELDISLYKKQPEYAKKTYGSYADLRNRIIRKLRYHERLKKISIISIVENVDFLIIKWEIL